jgi:hypothetical protein
MVVILILALLSWGAMLAVIVISGALAAGPWPVAASLAAVAAACVPLFLICRSRFRRRIAELDRWMARLSGRPEAGDSRFDLLVEVSRQVPAWLSVREGDRFKRHPFLATATFIAGAGAAIIALQASAHSEDSSFPYLILMLMPFLAMLAGTVLAQRRAVRREREAVLARWKERTEASRRAMEEILGGP